MLESRRTDAIRKDHPGIRADAAMLASYSVNSQTGLLLPPDVLTTMLTRKNAVVSQTADEQVEFGI